MIYLSGGVDVVKLDVWVLRIGVNRISHIWLDERKSIMKSDPEKQNTYTEEEIKEENRKIRIFRFISDLTMQRLYTELLTIEEARDTVSQLRQIAKNLFPGKGDVFDLVVSPRMERVINERFGLGRTDLN